MTDQPIRPARAHRRRARRRRTLAVAASAALGALLLAGCSSPGDGRVQLDFFQFKGEALEDFNKIIDDFEATRSIMLMGKFYKKKHLTERLSPHCSWCCP